MKKVVKLVSISLLLMILLSVLLLVPSYLTLRAVLVLLSGIAVFGGGLYFLSSKSPLKKKLTIFLFVIGTGAMAIVGMGSSFATNLGLLPGTSVVIASDAPATTRAQAQLVQALYENRIQICDGVADQNKFTAAIIALPASGGKVELTEGTFILSTQFYGASNIEFCGMGAGSTTIICDATFPTPFTPMLNFGGYSNISLHDITIDCNELGQFCVSLDGSNNCSVYNCRLLDAVDDCVSLDKGTKPAKYNLIHDNYISRAVTLSADSHSGVEIQGGSCYNKIYSNYITGTGYGVSQYTHDHDTLPTENQVFSNTFYRTTISSIMYYASADTYWGGVVSNNIIIGNSNVPDYGISIVNAIGGTISGNWVYQCDFGYSSASSDSLTFTGNGAYGCSSCGFGCYGANMTFSGNTAYKITGANHSGFNDALTTGVMTGNQAYGCTTGFNVCGTYVSYSGCGAFGSTYGFQCSGKYNTLTGCTAKGCSSQGYRFVGGDNTLIGCTSTGNDEGIYITGATTTTKIVNCDLRGNTTNSYRIYSSATPALNKAYGNQGYIAPGEIQTFGFKISALTTGNLVNLLNPLGTTVIVTGCTITEATISSDTTPPTMDIGLGATGADATTFFNSWNMHSTPAPAVMNTATGPTLWGSTTYFTITINGHAATAFAGSVTLTITGY